MENRPEVTYVTTEVINGQTVQVKHYEPGRALGAHFDTDGAHHRIRELVARPIARSGWHYSKLYASQSCSGLTETSSPKRTSSG